jgi:hypothetical protein
VKEYMKDPQFTYDSLRTISIAGAGLLKWVSAEEVLAAVMAAAAGEILSFSPACGLQNYISTRQCGLSSCHP